MFDVISLVVFSIACLNICVIAVLEGYIRLRNCIENYKEVRLEKERMIEMSKLSFKKEGSVKKSMLERRSRVPT